MDTMLTKWEIMKIWEDPPLSGFDHQKTYTHPIFRNLHRISLYIKWFWSKFCHSLSSLVPELPIISKTKKNDN